MEEKMSSHRLAAMVSLACLSPAAALAGAVQWQWLVLWTMVGAAALWLLMKWFGEPHPAVIGALALWGVLVAAHCLTRAAARIQHASSGENGVWLAVILGLVLLYLCWGENDAFLRLAEVLWPAMLLVTALVLLVGLCRSDWHMVAAADDRWLPSLWGAGELFGVFPFLLPYIYKEERKGRNALAVCGATVGGVAVLCAAMTVGLLGPMSQVIVQPFFVAGGLLGRSSRCEGVLSVLWVLPDLMLAGIACRVCGKWLSVGAAMMAVLLSLLGLGERITPVLWTIVSAGLLLLAAIIPKKKGK